METNETQDPTATEPKTIPYGRFQEVHTSWKAAEAERDTARTELEQAQARVAELEQAQLGLTTERDRVSLDLQLADHGLISDEGRDIARALHARVQGDDKPDLGAWFAEHGKAHPALAAYLTPSAVPAEAPSAPPATQAPELSGGAEPPGANEGAKPPVPPRPATLEALRQAREDYKANPTDTNRRRLEDMIQEIMSS